MRYAILTDVHANLEAMEAVLAKIDELARQEPIDQIWFLGDLVGYGPDPNACIEKLRARTDVIIAGNHDWAAVGKIDLDDFSDAARISAEWTARQLTRENREFLANLPERISRDDCNCLLVHGSPYGPLWEYLTSEVLAERSFEYFSCRFCFVGHTHVPVIFQQPYPISDLPTAPLPPGDITAGSEHEQTADEEEEDDEATTRLAALPSEQHSNNHTEQASNSASAAADSLAEAQQIKADDAPDLTQEEAAALQKAEVTARTTTSASSLSEASESEQQQAISSDHTPPTETHTASSQEENTGNPQTNQDEITKEHATDEEQATDDAAATRTPEEAISNAEARLNSEIEELLSLLGLSQSMINVTNEMIIPPEGDWRPPDNYRAIINPGGVGQPRDGDPRAAFMIYDTERGFTFYRVPYAFEKTQEKIIKAGLPPYLATRLAFGR
ncbi:MAG: metallophosphoesterase family protein [Ktedonobacteraceae bacterium]|nr:metallophosphoesterase family protein [Ktedonobacteraceae bacterium]